MSDAPQIFDQSWLLPFTPATVYSAWVANDTVIPPAVKMDIKPVVGGHYRLHAKSGDYENSNEGTFLEVVQDQRLRYTWQWQGDAEVSEILVTFVADDEGTRLRLRHEGFQSEQSYDNHKAGWESYVAGLTEFLTQRGAK